MEQKTLSKWLKCILVGAGVCGAVVYFGILPIFGSALRELYPAEGNPYYPWLFFLWASGIPCYAVLVLGWKIAGNIGADRSFSQSNAKLLGQISILSAADAAFFFVGNVVLLFLNISHPSIALASLLVVFAGAAISVASAVLSHLVKKAADLQEQSDWTI